MARATRRIQWQKIKVSDERYESAGVFDVNNDGILDIVSGAYWYEGPNWTKHKICDVRAVDEYYDDFSTIPVDVNGNGYLDFITGGWWGEELVWRENPKGQPVEWQTHSIGKVGSVETTRAWDVDGDGELEFCPNTPGAGLRFFKLVSGSFKEYVVSDVPQGHGLGFGDVFSNGKGCFVVHNGFWEPTGDPLNDPWRFIEGGFELGMASVPILVVDANQDGKNELVVGQAHGYGLDYYTLDGSEWTKHPIDPWFSQYHDMLWVDIDGDGENEIVTGCRHRAHCGREPGEDDMVGIYIFKWNGESFTKQVVDYGPVPYHSGTGIFFQAVDLDGNGRLDIVAPGKDGLFVFKNLGLESIGA